MAVLGAVSYDPATRVQLSTASALAMTALDTTNLRITFTAPSNGAVSVRLKGQTKGGTSGAGPGMYLGVLDGASVRGRLCPVTAIAENLATTQDTREAIFTVTGLTASQSYTWDAAYGVEGTAASTNLEYGGPDNTTTDDAAGAFQFEIWEATNLLVGKLYDPASLVTKTTTALLALTAFDTTNLRATFTAPGSGNVYWRIQTLDQGNNTHGQIMLGILDGATIKARTFAAQTQAMPTTGSGFRTLEASGVITGLTGGTSYSFDAAYGVEIVSLGGGIKYGGPNNATINDAGGGFAYEIWAA